MNITFASRPRGHVSKTPPPAPTPFSSEDCRHESRDQIVDAHQGALICGACALVLSADGLAEDEGVGKMDDRPPPPPPSSSAAAMKAALADDMNPSRRDWASKMRVRDTLMNILAAFQCDNSFMVESAYHILTQELRHSPLALARLSPASDQFASIFGYVVWETLKRGGYSRNPADVEELFYTKSIHKMIREQKKEEAKDWEAAIADVPQPAGAREKAKLDYDDDSGGGGGAAAGSEVRIKTSPPPPPPLPTKNDDRPSAFTQSLCDRMRLPYAWTRRVQSCVREVEDACYGRRPETIILGIIIYLLRHRASFAQVLFDGDAPTAPVRRPTMTTVGTASSTSARLTPTWIKKKENELCAIASVSPSSVRSMCKRLRELIETDNAVAATFARC